MLTSLAVFVTFASPVQSGQSVLDACAARLASVQAVSLTISMEVMGEKQQMNVTMMRGGYVHAINTTAKKGESSEMILSPSAGWELYPKEKRYAKRPAKADKDALPGWETMMPGVKKLTAKGQAERVKFHGHEVLRVSVEPDEGSSPGAKVYVMFDPSTKLPVGFSADAMILKLDMRYSNVKLNPPVTVRDFQWKPPAGWKLKGG